MAFLCEFAILMMVINMEKQLAALLEDIDYEISVLSNMCAFLHTLKKDVSWTGFYLFKNNKLILGPFQGKVACTKIPLGKGVCGTSALKKETIVVENVHEFKGHIACDSESNSEIVVPILIEDTLYGVLDIDSTSYNRFQIEDKIQYEKCVEVLVNKLKELNL